MRSARCTERQVMADYGFSAMSRDQPVRGLSAASGVHCSLRYVTLRQRRRRWTNVMWRVLPQRMEMSGPSFFWVVHHGRTAHCITSGRDVVKSRSCPDNPRTVWLPADVGCRCNAVRLGPRACVAPLRAAGTGLSRQMREYHPRTGSQRSHGGLRCRRWNQGDE